MPADASNLAWRAADACGATGRDRVAQGHPVGRGSRRRFGRRGRGAHRAAAAIPRSRRRSAPTCRSACAAGSRSSAASATSWSRARYLALAVVVATPPFALLDRRRVPRVGRARRPARRGQRPAARGRARRAAARRVPARGRSGGRRARDPRRERLVVRGRVRARSPTRSGPATRIAAAVDGIGVARRDDVRRRACIDP